MSHDAICRNLSRWHVASCVSASKRGSSFCSLSQLNLQNEDPIDFASVGNEQSKAFKRGSSFCSLSRLYLQNEDPIHFASVDNERVSTKQRLYWLISRQVTTNKTFKRGSSFRVSRQRTKHLSEGLRFVVWPSLIYKTKTPFISRQVTTNKAFKLGSSFCSLSRLNLQNEDPTTFASVGVWGKALTRNPSQK